MRWKRQSSKPFGPLQKELADIESYLSLQILRHGRKLVVHKQVAYDMLQASVPIDFLRPIVENAFIHGFKNITGKMEITRAAYPAADEKISITISNNGAVLSPQEIKRVNERIVSGGRHGVSLIYSKRNILYGNNFMMTTTT